MRARRDARNATPPSETSVMKFSSWLDALKTGPARRPIRRAEPRRKSAGKLAVEHLEDRTVPAFLAPQTDYAVGSYPIAAVSGDFNGDGDPDLAVANYYAG